MVATELTVYGIETLIARMSPSITLTASVATELTVYGIETIVVCQLCYEAIRVATELTVYGIETSIRYAVVKDRTTRGLQQSLPFTVLKRCSFPTI